MHVRELEQFIGLTGLLKCEGLRVPVVITDVKRAYGNLRYQVRPHDSRPDLGLAWVAASRVQLDRERM